MPRNVRGGARRKGGGGKPGGNALGARGQGGPNSYQPGGSFFDFQAKPVAGGNQFLGAAGTAAQGFGAVGRGNAQSAADLFANVGAGSQFTRDATSRATSLADQRSPEFLQAMEALGAMGDVSRRQVTGANLEKDPAFLAAQRAYSNTIGRSTQNAAALAGLGRSTAMTSAQAAGRSRYLMPTIQNALAREERGITRELGALGTQAQGYFGASGQRGADARTAISSLMSAGQQRAGEQLSAAGGFQNAAAAERSQAAQNIGIQQGLGTQGRAIEQERLDAPYNEQMRLYSEALNSMYGPLGMIGGLIGGTNTTSKK